MRVFKKGFYISFVMLLMMGLLAGCAGSKTNQTADDSSKGDSGKTTENKDEKPVELSFIWWGEQARHDRTQEAIKLFEEQNPDIRIKAEFSGGTDTGRSWRHVLPVKICLTWFK